MSGTSRRTARRNRLGLALVGLVLTLAGATVLARGLAIRPSLLGTADSPILGGGVQYPPAGHWWFWLVIAIIAAVIALLALRWLTVQTRADIIRELKVEPDTRHGTTHLPARAASEALQDDLTASPYVQRANATLTGISAAPRLALTLTLTADAAPDAADRHTHQAISRLRHALETDHLPATITIRTTPTRR